MPHSMTGFARLEQQFDWGTLACEIRSVNHRYLEPTVRLPEMLRAIENTLRQELKKHVSRGKLDISIYAKFENAGKANLALNESLANDVVKLAEKLSNALQKPADISPLEILKWPGVLQTEEVDKDALESAALGLFNQTLNALLENRKREGKELKQFIEQRLDAIERHGASVRSHMPEILEAHHNKLREKLTALQVDVDEERLTQELVYIAQKADVAEELDRLEAHLGEVKLSLAQQKPMGRRLDFLMQELNREANTLSSKSLNSDTTQVAVELKVLIEQMREQIQNIE